MGILRRKIKCLLFGAIISSWAWPRIRHGAVAAGFFPPSKLRISGTARFILQTPSKSMNNNKFKRNQFVLTSNGEGAVLEFWQKDGKWIYSIEMHPDNFRAVDIFEESQLKNFENTQEK